MKLKDIKIRTKLGLGLASMLFFIALLGIISLKDGHELNQQTRLLYEHSVKVAHTLGDLEADILKMRLGTRDLMLSKTDEERQKANQSIEVASVDAHQQFNFLQMQYLGPKQDVIDVINAFIRWESARKENLTLAVSGEIEKVKNSVQPTGKVGMYREDLLSKIEVLNSSAQNKTEELFLQSNHIKQSLALRAALILIVILFLTSIINYSLIRSVRRPLNEMTRVTDLFREGNFNERCDYHSANEFGVLSAAINSLADKIQLNINLTNHAAKLAGAMMMHEDAHKFFRTTLSVLASETEAQITSAFLLSSDGKTYNHFESIGLDSTFKQSFSAESFEGEFGLVLSEKQIVRISEIPKESNLIFSSVAGGFKPREILSIPILDSNQTVVAIITLVSIKNFSEIAIRLIHETYVMLTARVNGVLTYDKTNEYSIKLDNQNKEMTLQAKEMAMQTDELKEYNIELELQKKQLDEANQLKSTFLSNMSHELRTPLNSVIALSGVLNRRLKNQIGDDEYSYLGIIEKNGKQLLSLINDILDLSRIEAGKEEINNSQFTIQSIVNGIVDSLHSIASEKGIELINLIPPDIKPIVSDSKKCHHILQNIISNAVKFTEKGCVRIDAEMRNDNVLIRITDTGIGISNDHLPYIFDEFRQADGKSSRKYGGTGLGLAIAKKYTHLLGGKIEVHSKENEGSVFEVILPEKPFSFNNAIVGINDSAQINFKSSVHSPAPPRTVSGKTLLIVEDSEPQIIQLVDILTDEGFQIRVAHNGKEALESIKASIPDALILDLMMPEVDGFEVLKSIRNQKETCHIPVLILSAKHITKEESSFLTGNHIYQLIQKGDINRSDLISQVTNMVYPPEENKQKTVLKPKIKCQAEKSTLLLIEDNEDNIITVKALLGEQIHLYSSTDGISGLETARSLSPDLILLDISLPEMDGFEVLKELKADEHLRHIPVIALTARAMKGDRENLLEYGFDGYISKPIDNVLFGETIFGWLTK